MGRRHKIERLDCADALIGRTITGAEEIDGKYVRLLLDDASAATFEGIGYDGLWDDVCVTITPTPSTSACPAAELPAR